MDKLLERFASRIENFDIADFIDIFLLASLFFLIYRFIRKRRAFPILIGVFFFIAVRAASKVAGLDTLFAFIDIFYLPGLVMIAVIFQTDLRAWLEKTGAGIIVFFKVLFGKLKPISGSRDADAVVKAVMRLSATRTGALIVLERNTGVDDICQNGTRIDAIISSELICNLFFAPAPLHDGAIIVRGKRIFAAGCFLPNYTDQTLSSAFGSRHRAAIGMSRASDAGILVISEEDGKISYAENGELLRAIDETKVRQVLDEYYGVARRAKK